ncbi:MAG: hypothetical protein ACYCSN_15070 [Acidobacteriaceae bacterium]
MLVPGPVFSLLERLIHLETVALLCCCSLLAALCPAALHGFGDALPPLGAQFALLGWLRCRLRDRDSFGCRDVLAAFGPSRTCLHGSRTRPREQSSRLLQFRYFSINFRNNSTYLHALPPGFFPPFSCFSSEDAPDKLERNNSSFLMNIHFSHTYGK